MSSYSKINKVIQNKLNSKRKILSRQGSSDIYSPSDENSRKQHQQNIIKTPYIIMVSTDKLQDKEDNKIGDNDFFMLSNQEYSKNNKNINVGTNLYNARSPKGKTKVPYRPAPGIKDLTSEFISTSNTQFNRQVTVNFTCYSLADLEELNERFMSLERKVYVQWGWATNGKIEPLIDENGKVIYSGAEPGNKTEITKLQEEVITKGQGDFDAVIGFVKNISFSLREDGGFDCTTELLAQGINILDTPIEQGGDGNSDVVNKGLQFNEYSTQYGSFLEEINNLQNNASDIVGFGRQRNIYLGKLASETAEQTDSGDIEFKNLSIESKEFVYNENFVLTKKYSDNKDSYTYSEKDRIAGKSISSKDLGFNKANLHNDYLDDIDPNECWVRWGWFEDNLVNKYFALYDSNLEPISYYRSIEETEGEIDEIKFESIIKRKGLKVELRPAVLGGSYLDPEGAYTTGISETTKDGLPLNKDGKILKNRESIKVPNDKDFITTDIKQFIFPGKFPVDEKSEAILETLDEKISRAEKTLNSAKQQEGYNEANEKVEGTKEYQLIQQLKEARESRTLADTRFEEFNKVHEIRKEIYDGKYGDIGLDNLNRVTETGFDKYLYLYELANIFNKNTIVPKFTIQNVENQGYLRNIFINIGHLQSIFGNVSATTLGETMNALFSSLASNSVNQIDLITRYNVNKGDGRYGAETRIPTEEPSYGPNYSKDLEKGEIYEFAVHQQDSIVLSQEIATDLTNTQMQVLMSKNLTAKVKKQLDKKGISPQHQVNFSQVDSTGNKVSKTIYDKQVGLEPAFIKFGLKYGNPSGANPDLPIEFWPQGISDDSGQKFFDRNQVKQNIEVANSQAEKDLELATDRFSELPIAYTIDGKLKSDTFKNMTDKLNIEVEERTDEEGNTKILTFPKVSDFGLIGLTTTLTLTGIAGIYPSNVFTTTYLPEKFKVNKIAGSESSCHFWTTGVTQNCSAESWTTQLEARMAWRFVKDE